MFKNLLPPLNEDHQLPAPANAGAWVKDDNALLGRIRDGLKAITIEQEVEEIISIPDVWARVTVVKNALFDDRHPLNYQIRGEWRGLLATFALMPYHKKSVETFPINIHDLKEDPYKVPPNEEGTRGNFAEVLATITPGSTLAQGQNWGEIGIIKLDKKPIGLLVPNTIVSPAKFYSNSIPQGIDWFQGGKFIDPCEAANIQPEQFVVLMKFIDDISNGLKQISMADKANFDGIQGELDLFKKDCEERVEAVQSGAVEIAGFTRHNVSLRFPQQPIYSLLQNIYEYDTGGKVAYSTLLRPRKELESHIPGIILVDEDIPHGIGKAASDIRIWNVNTIETVINDKKIKKQVEKEINKAGYLYLYPEELFTKKLCLLYGDDKIKDHNDYISRPYLLPFNPIILTALTPTQLRNNFQIKDNGESFAVSLKLDLHNHLGEKTNYVIRKEYGKNDIEDKKTLPISSFIWPNFTHPAWKQYLLFYSCNPQESVSPRTIFSIEGLLKEIANHKSTTESLNFFNSLKDKSVKLSKRLPILEKMSNLTELHHTESPPEAIMCDSNISEDIPEFLPSEEREPMGLALASKPSEAILNNNRVSFGIDFGTTNTCAFMRVNDETPRVIDFKNRIYSPFTHNLHDEALVYVLRDYLPDREIKLPFLTISRDRNVGINKGDIQDELPIWSAIIYFVGDMRDALADILDDKQSPLHFNLKWSKSPEDRGRIALYLAQVSLQCLAEALASGADLSKLTWNFSYPESFSPSQLRNFHEIFKKSMYLSLQPFDQNIENQKDPFHSSESLSSALYFANQQGAKFVESVVTIDIGGHTSDISIWQNLKLLWRNSAQIAGRHILINFLIENPKIIDLLSKKDPMRSAYDDYLADIVTSSGKDKIAIRNAIEIIVNSKDFANSLKSNFMLIDGEDVGHNLRLIGNLALSGILYYTGQIISYLSKEKNLYNPKTEATRIVNVCLGGRASLLYKVIMKHEKDQEELALLFSKATDGIVKQEQVEFIFTDDPKHEVAHGLLVDMGGMTDLDTSKRCYALLLGEDVEVGRNVVTYKTPVNDLDLEKQLRIIDLNNIKKFADILKESMGIIFDLSRKDESAIAAKINTTLVDSQHEALKAKENGVPIYDQEIMAESSRIEPPFIVALKEILERISQNKIRIQSTRH